MPLRARDVGTMPHARPLERWCSMLVDNIGIVDRLVSGMSPYS